MTKICELQYKDVKDFAKGLNRKTKRGTDRLFINIVDTAMENTTTNAKQFVAQRTDRYSGELEDGWGKKAVVEPTERKGKSYVKSVTNAAFNPRAEEAGKDGYYAEFVEEGHKKVPWRAGTHAIHALSDAEEDTEHKLQQIVDDEVKKFFGGLFS